MRRRKARAYIIYKERNSRKIKSFKKYKKNCKRLSKKIDNPLKV